MSSERSFTIPSSTGNTLSIPSATTSRPPAFLEDGPKSTSSSGLGSTTSTPTACITPNIVVVDLSTTIEIPDYRRFYQAPIQSFQPTYTALPDGSLVSPPLLSDISRGSGWLLMLTAIATLFLINTLTSARYIRKGHVKNKALFYLLLCSQILGVLGSIPMIVSFFDSSVNCTVAANLFKIAMSISYSLLITGILGIKAYRCLNNSYVVLAVLTLLRTAMIVLLCLDIAQFRGFRRLSGSCGVARHSKIVPLMVILQFAESLFICICFLVAVWLTHRTPIDHGRLSIGASANGGSTTGNGPAGRRGWWDYVPDPVPTQRRPTGSSLQTGKPVRKGVFSCLSCVKNSAQKEAAEGTEKSAGPEATVSKPVGTRTSSVAFVDTRSVGQRASVARTNSSRGRQLTVPDRPPSAISRISKYMPRMRLLKKVLRNELLYTTFSTAMLLVTAVVMLVGTTCNFLLGPSGWLVVNWTIVSIFTMDSFGRVYRRHEKEAILQHPSAWDPIYRAELEASRAFNQGRPRRAYSPVSVISRHPRLQEWTGAGLMGGHELPPKRPSLSHMTSSSRPPSGPSHLQRSPRPWLSHHSPRSSLSSYTSTPESTMGHIPPPRRLTDADVLPSPGSAESSHTAYSDTPSDSQYILRHSVMPAGVLSSNDSLPDITSSHAIS
ncbi:hypothetical protein K474DRAFT_1617326 [Panus rudis PR-1116 ss-1]|nr:hypothetical protein K474DRAFT_1617326 [Panus rudis PR-1116 ss-1]